MNIDSGKNNPSWGITVSIPHFLAAIFATQMKILPAELLLPDVSTLYLPEQAYSPVHHELSKYLPADFGEAVITGNLVYPVYPFVPSVFVITRSNWLLLHNFQEMLLSAPRSGEAIHRAQEMLRFGMDMFVEKFSPATIAPVTVGCAGLLSEDKILARLHSPAGITPTTIFESLESNKYDQLKSWFAQHAVATARYLQFHTPLGTLSVISTLTGGELISIIFHNKYPKNIVFYPFSDQKFTSLLKSLLPDSRY